MNNQCKWQYDEEEDIYNTECGEFFEEYNGISQAFDFFYCPFCGKEKI